MAYKQLAAMQTARNPDFTGISPLADSCFVFIGLLFLNDEFLSVEFFFCLQKYKINTIGKIKIKD